MTVVVGLSAAMLLLLWVEEQFGSKRGMLSRLLPGVVLAFYITVLHFAFGFPSLPPQLAKGGDDSNPGPLVLALFVSMVLGMFAQYLYHNLDSDPGKTPFDWRGFVKPFLVSPMVFVPLAASLQNTNVNLSHFDIPVLMLFLVAFENGFLWRGYFNRKMTNSSANITEPKPAG